MEYFGGEIKWLVSGDIHQREIFDCEGRITEGGLRNSNAKLLPVNSVLIALNGQGKTRGTVAILRTQATCNQSLVSISPKDTSVLLPEFLYGYLRGRYQEIRRMTGDDGNDRRGLNMRLIGGIDVPIAPIAEQGRVVGILDQAFAAVNIAMKNTERNLGNARELSDGALEAVFNQRASNWEKVSLQTLLDRGWIEGHLDGNHGSDYPRKEEFVSQGVPYISANCIENGDVDMARAKYLSVARADKIRKGVAKDGDVLFAHNATVGPVAILASGVPRVILGTSLTYYRCNKKFIIPEYLALYMKSSLFAKQYVQVMRQSTRNQVPITKQREFFHVIPPRDEQVAIIKDLTGLLDATGQLAALNDRKLECLSYLGPSLLASVFTGAL